MSDAIYQKLKAAYNPSERCAECPDPDASLLRAMEFSFALPIYLTQDQQRRLHELLAEIVDAPWNEPVEGVHWLAEWGSKPHWQEPKEPTFDDEVLTGASCARQFVADTERARVMERRAKPPKPNPERDVTIEALEFILNWFGPDPDTDGTEGVKLARKCARALAALREAKAIARDA